MPSGAKKRKAAAKKKKEAHINTTTTTSHVNNDLKGQESDGGEVSSPVSQDNQNNNQDHPFNEEEENRGTSPVRSNVSENTSVEVVHKEGEDTNKVVAEDVGGVLVTRELSIGQDSESKDVSVEHVDSVKKSHSRSSSSSSSSSQSSSSSSDDESRVVEKNSAAEVTYVSDNAPAGEAYNLVVETEPVVDSVKLDEPVLEKVIPLTEIAPFETSVNSDVAELGIKEKDGKLLPSLDEYTGDSVTVIDIGSKKIEEGVFPLSYENGGGSSSANGVVTKENGDKLLQSSNTPILETSTCGELVKDSDIPECSENQPLVAAAPREVQTTSWKSCCGLFEVLTGSSRTV